MRILAIVAVTVLLQGCSLLQSTPLFGTDELNRNIANNAEILGDAHANATAGIILENILKARDRWHTSYTTVSGITATPQMDFNASGSFGPLGLGNPAGPFQESTAGIEQKSKSAASYAVNPFTSANDGKNLSDPISDEVFAKYWTAGWPKDLLLMVLVDSIKVGGSVYQNDFEDPEAYIKAIAPYLGRTKCKALLSINGLSGPARDGLICNQLKYSFAYNDQVPKGECKVIESIDRVKFIDDKDVGGDGLLSQISELNTLDGGNLKLDYEKNAQKIDIRICGSFKEYKLRPKLNYDQPNDGGLKEVSKTVQFSGDTEEPSATLKLRSIDSAIYFIGEWLRLNGDNERSPKFQQMGFVTAPPECIPRGSIEKRPASANRLFSVYQRGEWSKIYDFDHSFAARARHASKRFAAVKQLDLVAARCNQKNSNTPDVVDYCKKIRASAPTAVKTGLLKSSCDIDRSGTMMALLVQLYLRSQSPDFLKGPEASILRTQ